jgi:hypothetical protein
MRHSLQAKGIKTGHLSDQVVAQKYSALTAMTRNSDLNRILERIPTPERRQAFMNQFNRLTDKDKRFVVTILKDTDEDKVTDLFDCNPYNPHEQDLKEFVQKAEETIKSGAEKVGEGLISGAEWVKEEIPIVEEKLKAGYEKVKEEIPIIKEKVQEGLEKAKEEYQEFKEGEESAQREATTAKRQRIYSQVGRKYKEPEPKVEQDEEVEEVEEVDSESLPQKLGRFMAEISEDYTPEDLVGLNDKELEMLAVRFKTQNKDSWSPFGDPENPFLVELRNRIQARDELKKEKAELREELKHPKKEEGLFEGLLDFD